MSSAVRAGRASSTTAMRARASRVIGFPGERRTDDRADSWKICEPDPPSSVATSSDGKAGLGGPATPATRQTGGIGGIRVADFALPSGGRLGGRRPHRLLHLLHVSLVARRLDPGHLAVPHDLHVAHAVAHHGARVLA